MILLCLLLLAYFLFFLLFSLSLSRRAFRAWNEECDPEPLLDFSLNDLKRYSSPQAQITSHCNAGAALHGLGRFQEALEHLDPTLLTKVPGGKEYTILLWLNRSAVFYDLAQPEAMAHCLSMAEQALATSSLKPAQQALCAAVLEQNRLACRLLTEGPGPEIEAGYQRLLSAAETTQERVSRHFALAQCALAREDTATAREHLDYVIAHGNKLFARAKALELLSSLSL